MPERVTAVLEHISKMLPSPRSRGAAVQRHPLTLENARHFLGSGTAQHAGQSSGAGSHSLATAAWTRWPTTPRFAMLGPHFRDEL